MAVSLFSLLPNELKSEILSKLDNVTICKAVRVCKAWEIFINSFCVTKLDAIVSCNPFLNSIAHNKSTPVGKYLEFKELLEGLEKVSSNYAKFRIFQ